MTGIITLDVQKKERKSLSLYTVSQLFLISGVHVFLTQFYCFSGSDKVVALYYKKKKKFIITTKLTR